ncbi:MAG: 3-dehydroquinate synthase [Pseudomonadota bacterium]
MTDHKILTVDLGERSYPIHIGAGLLDTIADLIPMDLSGRSVFILTDENVLMPHAQKVSEALKPIAARVETKTVLPGERSKSYDTLQDVLNWLLDHKVDRSSVLIAVGGGVIGDLGGFAASIVMRGIPYVQVPTTLLSMVDSSVGGKTGINSAQGKNLIGAFYQPVAVIADTGTLETLSDREMKAGYAEVVKYGLINNPEFFAWLEDNGADVLSLKPDALTYTIATSCQAKADIVAADETENNVRALLNLGHTFGHALEAEGGYDGTILHGEAVSIGMVMAHNLSARMGLCSDDDVQKVRNHLSAHNLPTHSPIQTNADTLMNNMMSDKKMRSGKLTFVLTKGIGQAFLNDNVDMADVKAVLEEELKR